MTQSDLTVNTAHCAAPQGAPVYLQVDRGVAMMGSENSLRKILKTVDVSLSDSIPKLFKALEEGDSASTNRLLHGIKGYTPIFCSDALIEQVTSVEKQSKTASTVVMLPLVTALALLLQSLLVEIRVFVAKA